MSWKKRGFPVCPFKNDGRVLTFCPIKNEEVLNSWPEELDRVPERFEVVMHVYVLFCLFELCPLFVLRFSWFQCAISLERELFKKGRGRVQSTSFSCLKLHFGGRTPSFGRDVKPLVPCSGSTTPCAR